MKTLLLILALNSSALAHTAVTAVIPVRGALVAAPASVRLTFSEPIELRFSTLRVMAVPAGLTPETAAKKALAERPDSARLVSLPPRSSALAAQVSVPLKGPLNAGPYVIAWTLLSEDGHPVTGFSVFRVK